MTEGGQIIVAKERRAENKMKKKSCFIKFNGHKIKAVYEIGWNNHPINFRLYLGGIPLCSMKGIGGFQEAMSPPEITKSILSRHPMGEYTVYDSGEFAHLMPLSYTPDILPRWDKLLEIGAYLNGYGRQQAGLPPRYWGISDRESTNPSLSSNGGDYSFWRNFHPLPGGGYEVHYCTSADFKYCPKCGRFYQRGDSCDIEYDAHDYRTVDNLPDGAIPVW